MGQKADDVSLGWLNAGIASDEYRAARRIIANRFHA
jgi:hypothetical protein